MALEDEIIALRLELKGKQEVVSGLKSVDAAQKGVGDSTRKAGSEASKAERKTTRLSNAYSALGRTAKWGLGFLGVGGVFALKQAVDASEDLAAATSGLTRNFGFQTNVASRWAAVMHGRGVEPKALTMAFGTLSSKMVEAGRKGGTALTPFHQLGMTQEEVARGARDFEWGLLRVAKALGDEEGGAKRSTAAKALLGKGFQTLTPLFSEGVEGLQEQLHWADKYGVTLSTTTKDGLMDMVVAGRETKVALLGIQIAMTKAAMPAIEAGQEELHRFIETLNDPDLSADQKMARIEQQFEQIEDTLIDLLTDAIPIVAEQGGRLGSKLAGSLAHGFLEADIVGKIVIGTWIYKALGGRVLVDAASKRIGMRIGGRISLGIAAGVIGYELWEKLSDKTKWEVQKWAHNAAYDFVDYFLTTIEDKLDDANFLSWAGVDAPNFGRPMDRWDESDRPGAPGSTQVGTDEIPPGAGTKHIPPQLPGGGVEGWPKGKGGRGGRSGRRSLAALPALTPPDRGPIALDAIGGGVGRDGARRPLSVVIPVQLKVDGRVIAEANARAVIDAESLA